jgi:peptide/nickel transport system permease protein
MARFAVRRLVQLVPILLGLSVLLFLFVQALPGDPANALLNENATAEDVARVRELYGLDRPLPEQYLTYMKDVARGDFGQSISTRLPVADEITRRFPATVELTVAALVFAIGLGIPLGFLAARRFGSWFDHVSMAGSLVGISVPVFVLAPVLKYVFAEKLGWLPTIGRLDLVRDLDHPTGFYTLDALVAGDLAAFWDAVRHMILPGLALGTIPLALVTRITRAAVLEVVNEDYVRTARAKGLPAELVNRRHVLRNAMLPITTVVGLQVGLLLAGAVLTETVFAWGGMGQLMSEAIRNRDYPVLQNGILFLAVVVLVINALVDIAYGLLDPRIRVS